MKRLILLSFLFLSACGAKGGSQAASVSAVSDTPELVSPIATPTPVPVAIVVATPTPAPVVAVPHWTSSFVCHGTTTVTCNFAEGSVDLDTSSSDMFFGGVQFVSLAFANGNCLTFNVYMPIGNQFGTQTMCRNTLNTVDRILQ